MNTAMIRHQNVRDLAWVMNSPMLLAQQNSPYHGDKVTNAWCQRIYQENISWLVQLDKNPELLLQWLAQNETPLLGIYFEALLAFWLRHLPNTEVLAQNLIVGEPGRQTGEFDLLFRNNVSQQVFHWEVAVKYYLRYGTTDYQWLGPNPRDSLQRKLDKVFHRQLLLSQQTQAKDLLQTTIGTTQIRSQAFIKGYLFYPHDSDWQQPASIPPGVATDHLKGWWLHHAASRQFIEQRPDGHRWQVLPRKQWLASRLTQKTDGLLDVLELIDFLSEHFSRHYQAVLLVELEQRDEGWSEVSRGFVVNNAWPQ